MARICSGFTSCVETSFRIASMLGCPRTAARIWLDRHAGRHDAVRIARAADDPIRIEAAAEAEDLEEAPRSVERVLAAGEAARGELRGDHAVLRGAPDVQRLGHGAEVHADAGAHARGDRDRVRRALRVETEQLRRGRRRAERADGARRVKALLVVLGMDRLGDLALDLEADQIRLEEAGARRRRGARRARGSPRAAASSGASAARRCDPGVDDKLRVVEIQRVPARCR